MARKRNDKALSILAVIIVLPVLFTNWLYDELGIPTWLTYTLLLSAVITALFAYCARQNKRIRAVHIADIDSMTGIDFERYLQKLLTMQGYSVRTTPASGDLGVDLVASRNGDNIAIQVKRYNTKVSRRAISDAVAGMQHYRCNMAMVITNNYFSPGAVTLARSTGCLLADRDTLARWIVALQNTRYRNT